MRKLILFLVMLLWSGNGWAAFPTTNQLDNFTRANSTTTLGSNWAIDTSGNFGDLSGISSDLAYNPTNSNGNISLWSANSYAGPVIEVWVTYSTSDATANEGPVFSNAAGGATENGYQIAYVSSGSIQVIKAISGSSSSIKTISQTVSSGDSLGATIVVATGVITIWYKSGSGAWTDIGTVTDTTYTINYIGIQLGDGTVRASSFGGGNQNLNSGFDYGF